MPLLLLACSKHKNRFFREGELYWFEHHPGVVLESS